MEIFWRYKLVIKITNSTVLNKLQSYSRISALGPDGHCTSRFKRATCVSCGRPNGGRGSGSCGQGEGSQKPDFFVDIINGWTLTCLFCSNLTVYQNDGPRRRANKMPCNLKKIDKSLVKTACRSEGWLFHVVGQPLMHFKVHLSMQ